MDKRGVSIVIGYVILVAVAITMSFLVYAWMKSYVPKEKLECPNDVSIRIVSAKCVPGDGADTYKKIEVEIKNTGLFDINGYIAKGENTQGVLFEISEGTYIFDSSIPGEIGKAKPGYSKINLLGKNKGEGDIKEEIKSIEVIPIRIQTNKETGKDETAICGDAVVKIMIDEICLIVPEGVGEGEDDGNNENGEGEEVVEEGCVEHETTAYSNSVDLIEAGLCVGDVAGTEPNKIDTYWVWECGDKTCTAIYQEDPNALVSFGDFVKGNACSNPISNSLKLELTQYQCKIHCATFSSANCCTWEDREDIEYKSECYSYTGSIIDSTRPASQWAVEKN